MKANSEKTKQSNKATRRVLAGVLCGASVLSLVLSLVMPPISQAIANDAEAGAAVGAVADEGSLGEDAGADNAADKGAEDQNSDETEGGEISGDAGAAGMTSDDTEAEGAVQPADDGVNGENAIATAEEKAGDYTLVDQNVASTFTDGGKFRLKGSAYSDTKIEITKNTTIDLAGHMLYHGPGSAELFIVVKNGATLTIEDSAKATDVSSTVPNNPGQPATIEWGGNNGGTPQNLTYYETTSTPNADGPGTTETTKSMSSAVSARLLLRPMADRSNRSFLLRTAARLTSTEA